MGFFPSVSFLSILCICVGIITVSVSDDLINLGILADYDLMFLQGWLRGIGVCSKFCVGGNIGVSLSGFGQGFTPHKKVFWRC